LQAEAEQDEGREPHRDVGTALAEQPLDAVRIGEAQEDRC